jgi:hypothetical protein
MNHDDEEPSPEELAAAARLAVELEEPSRNPAAEMIRAAAGRAAPLGELRARALVREALRPRPLRRRRWWPALSLALAILLILAVRLWPAPLPERQQSRSAGLLVPGPFPPEQTAAERLDLVTADRLIVLREAHYRSGQ